MSLDWTDAQVGQALFVLGLFALFAFGYQLGSRE